MEFKPYRYSNYQSFNGPLYSAEIICIDDSTSLAWTLGAGIGSTVILGGAIRAFRARGSSRQPEDKVSQKCCRDGRVGVPWRKTL